MMNRTYSKLISYPSYEDRFKYLINYKKIGETTHDSFRNVYQKLLHSSEWKEFRRGIILRDKMLDLAHPEFPLMGRVEVHHIEFITLEDLLYNRTDKIFNPENVITVDSKTHKAIEFGDISYLKGLYITERFEHDTAPWRL